MPQPLRTSVSAVPDPNVTRWTNDALQRAIRMRSMGATYADIGKSVGKSAGCVFAKLERAGFEVVAAGPYNPAKQPRPPVIAWRRAR
jgi:hypothetical protein